MRVTLSPELMVPLGVTEPYRVLTHCLATLVLLSQLCFWPQQEAVFRGKTSKAGKKSGAFSSWRQNKRRKTGLKQSGYWTCIARCHKLLWRNIHGVIDGSQHLHHELRVQQHTVTRFPPELLLLPGEATYTQPEEGTHTYAVTWVRWVQHQATAGKNKTKGQWYSAF